MMGKKGCEGRKRKEEEKRGEKILYIYNRGIATCWLHRCHIFTTSSFTFFFFFFSFLYDTLFPGNSVTNVRPFCDEIAFDGGVRGRSSEEEA